MSSPGKGKARENPARAGMVATKAKGVALGKVTENRKWNTRALMVSVETVESMDTKLLIVGTSRRINLKVKARARENPK